MHHASTQGMPLLVETTRSTINYYDLMPATAVAIVTSPRYLGEAKRLIDVFATYLAGTSTVA